MPPALVILTLLLFPALVASQPLVLRSPYLIQRAATVAELLTSSTGMALLRTSLDSPPPGLDVFSSQLPLLRLIERYGGTSCQMSTFMLENLTPSTQRYFACVLGPEYRHALARRLVEQASNGDLHALLERSRKSRGKDRDHESFAALLRELLEVLEAVDRAHAIQEAIEQCEAILKKMTMENVLLAEDSLCAALPDSASAVEGYCVPSPETFRRTLALAHSDAESLVVALSTLERVSICLGPYCHPTAPQHYSVDPRLRVSDAALLRLVAIRDAAAPQLRMSDLHEFQVQWQAAFGSSPAIDLQGRLRERLRDHIALLDSVITR
jgi:hypothetical protein